MSEKIFSADRLAELLQKNWTSLLDKNLFMKRVMSDVQRTDLPRKIVKNVPPRQVKISITKFHVTESSKFELWVELQMPKDKGTVIGTNVYILGLDGALELKEAYGVCFEPETS